MRVDNVFTVSQDGGRDVNASTKSGNVERDDGDELVIPDRGEEGVTRDPGCIKLPKSFSPSLLSF